MKTTTFYLMAALAVCVMSMNNSNAQLNANLNLYAPFCAETPVLVDATNGLVTPHNYQELKINGIVMYSDTAASGSLPSSWSIYHTFTDSGAYTVQFIISDGISWDTAVQNVYIYPAAVVSIVASDTILCLGESVTLTAINDFINLVNWNDDNQNQYYGSPITVTPSTSTMYDLWVQQTNGCEGADTIIITVSPPTVDTVNISICQGESYLAGGNQQTTAGTYYDTLQNVFGCDSVITTNLTVNPVSSSVMNIVICQGDSIFAGGQWQMIAGLYYDTLQDVNGCDSVMITNLILNPVFVDSMDVMICEGQNYMAGGNLQTMPGTYYDTLQTIEGCDSVIVTNLSVFTVTASFTDSVVGLQVEFVNTSTPDSVDSYWNFGDGSSSNDLNPTHTYANSGNYHVCLTIYDSVNCNLQDVYCVDIQVGSSDTCFAAFSYFVQQVTEVVFLDSSQDANQWLWDFGDGTTSNIQNPVHQFPATGFYTVSLTTYDTTNGCSDQASALLTLGSADSLADCQADFSYYINNNNRKVWFTNQSLSGDSIVSALWNFGDGEVDTVWSPMHQYQQEGYYQVCLSIATVGGCDNISCQTILVGNPGSCSAKFIYTADVVTYQTFFTDVSVGIPPTDWNWNFGDGGQSILQNPVYTYADSGTYHVSMHIKDLPNGCNSHYNAVINLNPSVLIASGFVYTDNSSGKMAGGPYPINFFGAAFGDPATLLWDFGDGSLDSTTWWPEHVYQDSGVYNVCLTVSDPLRGSYSYCDTVYVTDTATHVSSLRFDEGIQVFPNPSNGMVFLKLNEPCSVSVYNLLGEKISAEKYAKAGLVNLHFNSGMYLLLIQAGDQLITKKVLIR